MLEGLTSSAPQLGGWYFGARSRRRPESQAIQADAAWLRPFVERGRLRKDIGRAVIEQLGYTVSLETEDRRDGVWLRVDAGGWSPHVRNSVMLLIRATPHNETLLATPEAAQGVLDVIVNAWTRNAPGSMVGQPHCRHLTFANAERGSA
jgi:hypothetical protein